MNHPYLLRATLMLVVAVPHVSHAQPRRLSDPATLREVEAEMFAEINRLRSDLAAYAETVLQPLKAVWAE